MKRAIAVLMALVFSLAARGAPPTEASVNRLLEVSGARQDVKQAQLAFDGSVQSMVFDELKQFKLNESQRLISERLTAELSVAVDAEFTWEKWRPILVSAYMKSLDQEEINNLIKKNGIPSTLREKERNDYALSIASGKFRDQLAPAKARMIAKIREATKAIRDQGLVPVTTDGK